MDSGYIASLACPYCGTHLSLERALVTDGEDIVHGIVQCGCYRYPLIDGILILKQQSGAADTDDPRVAHLDSGEFDLARERAMNPDRNTSTHRPRWKRVLRRVGLPVAPPAREVRSRSKPAGQENFASYLQARRPGLYGDYLYQRYANSSFLASVPPLLLLGDLAPGERVLELACGIGHTAYLIRTLFPELHLVATDHDFVNLTIAREHFARDATLLCLDAEAPLPFPDRSFGAVFCLDGFHYLRSKVALVTEISRAAGPAALWIFPHLHNRMVWNYNAGIPLSPADYARCFAAVDHRIFRETDLLRDFHSNGTLSLDRRTPAEDLNAAPNLTLIGSQREGFWRERTDLAGRLCAHPGKLLVNPIYRVSRAESQLRLTMQWPTERLHDECRDVEAYLPASCELDADLLARAGETRSGPEDMRRISELTRTFRLVNLPHPPYPVQVDGR